MIKIKNIVKKYDDFTALKGISFELEPGSITGLLGPNGAGKTTTLRILSGYLYPDEGEIEVMGRKFSPTPEFKKLIGYIPENNPLYDDFEVSQYLEWIAEIYSKDKHSVKKIIEECYLTDVIGKQISTLSKGYKQRLSLAKALLNSPPILLLDEPTTGLDPNQARNTRELIKNIKKDKTILISTHILTEVEYLCENAIIINKGEIAADGKIDNIVENYSNNIYVLKVSCEVNIDFSLITGFKDLKIIKEKDLIYEIAFSDNIDKRKEILNILKQKNIDFLEFYRKKISFDEVFKKITEN